MKHAMWCDGIHVGSRRCSAEVGRVVLGRTDVVVMVMSNRIVSVVVDGDLPLALPPHNAFELAWLLAEGAQIVTGVWPLIVNRLKDPNAVWPDG